MTEFQFSYEYLIHLIACAIHDEQPQEKPEGISFEEVFELGRLHEVGNIAFISVEKLQNKPEPSLFQEWQMFYYRSVQRDARQWEAREKILTALHEKGIRTLETQGTLTKRFYPETFWRMMTDTDLVVEEKDIEAIREIMTGFGYDVKDGDEGEINAYGDDGSLIEFHLDFFPKVISKREENLSQIITKPFDHAELMGDDPYTYKTNDTYYYLYTLFHTIKHFLNAGCGVRRVLDLYYTKPLLQTIDMSLVNELVDSFGYRDTVDKLYALEAFWFEGVTPTVDLSETITDVIISGNHGVYTLRLRNQMRKEKAIDGVRFPKLRRIRLFLFPTKEDIYDSYPKAKAGQYSLVRCWFHRAFHSLGKMRNMKNFVNRIMKTDV